MNHQIIICLFIFISGCAEENSKNKADKKIENNIQAAWHNEINNIPDKSQNLIIKKQKSKIDIALESADLGMLPYTCSPDRYPPHIILANRSCRPYLQRIIQKFDQ
jgi:hypothetical protein